MQKEFSGFVVKFPRHGNRNSSRGTPAFYHTARVDTNGAGSGKRQAAGSGKSGKEQSVAYSTLRRKHK